MLRTNRIFTAPPGFHPKLFIETQDGTEERVLPSDDHFKNMVKHFYSLITNAKPVMLEYEQNLQQARLINDFKSYAQRK